MSTVFLGTSDFAAAVLGRLAQSERHRPRLVITRPDRPAGRGRRLSSPPVAQKARELGLALAQPQSVNDEPTRRELARLGRGSREPATVVVCAFGALIKEPLLSQQPMLNVHPSLLPRWRGAAPVERAIMAGDERTGVSIMRLTEGLDNGPVCLAESIPIGPHDTYGTLASRLQALGGELLLRALEESPPFVEQPEEGVTYAEKIGPEDRTLDPARPAAELERVVRALAPHIGARIALKDGITLGVRSASALPASASEPEGAGPPSATGPKGARPAGSAGSFTDPAPGQLAVRGGRLLYGTIDGALELLAVQPPGGRAMDAGAYLRGHGLLAQ